VLEIEALVTAFDTPRSRVWAANGVSLRVAAGPTRCIAGESGCGKSVTALSIMGLLADKAHIEAGRIVFRIHGTAGPKEVRERALAIFKQVHIPDAARRLGEYPHQRSGGMKQRVTIAMALAHRPALLIADEPTTALGATIQARVLNLLAELQQRLKLAYLVVSHDLSVVQYLCDRVAVMYLGRVVEQAKTKQPGGAGLACDRKRGHRAPGPLPLCLGDAAMSFDSQAHLQRLMKGIRLHNNACLPGGKDRELGPTT